MKCPIAHHRKKRGNSPALSNLNYTELDILVRKLAANLSTCPSLIIGYVPMKSLWDIAFFFAAWRLGKVVYPLSARLPHEERLKRFHRIGATPVSSTPASWEYKSDTLDLERFATLLETSSGDKIACHTMAAHFASASAVSEALKIFHSSKYGLILPLNHISGIASIIRTFLSGGQVLLPDEIENATHLSAVSTQIFRFQNQKRNLPYLEHLLVGGGPMPDTLKNSPYPIHTSYGMTEAGSTIAIDEKPLSHLNIKIHQGEILLKGASMMKGYFGKTNTEEWFATGNLGEIKNHTLQVYGRLDRAFISGGEKIQPEKIEKKLLAIEGVTQASVTPSEDEEFGQIPTANIECDFPISYNFIKKNLEKFFPSYMIPKKIIQGRINSKLTKMAD